MSIVSYPGAGTGKGDGAMLAVMPPAEALDQVGIVFRLPAVLAQDEDWVIATCPPLDVASQGRSPDEARANLVDALTAFLLSCLERQTLDTVLRAAGFAPGSPPPAAEEHETDTELLSVPLPFVIHATHPDAHDHDPR
jgi:predicted RNase H-like HicB family nuclease